jgi:hypothetical protein
MLEGVDKDYINNITLQIGLESYHNIYQTTTETWTFFYRKMIGVSLD